MTNKQQSSKEFTERLVNAIKPHYVEGWGLEKAKKKTQFNVKHIQEAYEAGWDKAKSELLKEVKDWFCRPYCRFHGNDDFCGTCAMNKEECWLKD